MALKVNKKFTPYNHTELPDRNVKYIVIHWVGAASSAEANANYFYNGDRQASAHYFVDDDGCWQSVKEIDVAWAVGGGPLDQGSPYAKYGKKYFGKCTNSNSISIEMCCKKDKNGKLYITDKTIENTRLLVKGIKRRWNIKDENIIRHFDVNGKLCLPLDSTELLTKKGWIPLAEAQIGDEIAQYNTVDGSIDFVSVQNVVSPYEAETIKNRGFEATADHRMWGHPGCLNSHGLWRETTWGYLVDDPAIKRRQYIVPTSGVYHADGLSLSDDELRLLVWVQADGHYMKNEHHDIIGLEFHLKKERKIRAVCGILSNLDITYRCSYKNDGSVSIRMYDVRLVEWLEEWLDNKNFTFEFIEMNEHQFELFWNELVQADGSIENNSYFSSNDQNIEVVQAVCATKGARTNKCTTGKQIADTLCRSVSHYSVGYGEKIRRYTMVGCVTVPSGFILVRQNGKTFITGNCPGTYIEQLDWEKLHAKLTGKYFRVKALGNLIAKKEADRNSAQTRRLTKGKIYGIIDTADNDTRGKTVKGDWITITDKYVERLDD